MNPDDAMLAALRLAETASNDDRLVLLCFVAGRHVTLVPDELNAALRRSELLLAAGGDPRRPLELRGRAVSALADDLDGPERRGQLAEGLSSLRSLTEVLLGATEALAVLQLDLDLAWRCFAMALLAESLAEAE